MFVLVDSEKFYKSVNNGWRDSKRRMMGSSGYCRVNGNRIIKIYNQSRIRCDFSDFSSYKSYAITFPKKYYVDSKNGSVVIGELMDFCTKMPITSSIDDNTSLSNFLNNYQNMVAIIKEFPEIRMYDMVNPNILYNEETGFTLIDTFEWVIKNDSYNVIFNIKDFCENFINLIIYKFINYSIQNEHIFMKYGKPGQEFLKILVNSQKDSSNIEELIELYRLLIYKVFGANVRTFGDIKNYAKILKKG